MTPALTAHPPAIHRTAPNDPVQISYVDTGNKTGVPVIFLHAFPMNKSMWTDQLSALKETARVIAFDVRGMGQSQDARPYSLEFVVDDLFALMDQLGLEKAVVCGLSMGGFVALRAAERNPERFLGVVLADTKSDPDSDASKLRRYEAIKAIHAQGLAKYTDEFVKGSIADADDPRKRAVLERAQRISRMNTPDGVSAAALALMSRTDTTPDLAKIQVPTLIMHGEKDAVIPRSAASALHEKIPDSEFFIVPDAGHLSNLDNPDAFNGRLLEFVNRFDTRNAPAIPRRHQPTQGRSTGGDSVTP